MRRFVVILGICALLLSFTTCAVFAADNSRVELKHMRTEFTKVFKNGDGTVTRQYWVNPVHYQDENAQWQEIELGLKDLAKDNKAKDKLTKDLKNLLRDTAKTEGVSADDFTKGVTNHLFKMYFPKNLKHSLEMVYGDYVLSMKPLNISPAHKEKVDAKAVLSAHEMLYTDVWYHTDLKYEVAYNGISEYIILKDMSAEKNFSFSVKGKGLELKTTLNGDIAAYARSTGQVLFYIPAPRIWDAKNVFCEGAKYELKADGENYLLTLVYDQNYLTAEGRAYPVTIDPDITLARNYVDEMTYLDSNNPTTNYYSGTHMEIGNYKVWNWWMWDHWEKTRSLCRFNRLTADLGPVSDQVQVVSAKLYLTCSENKTESTYVDVYHVNYSATDWEVTQATWNSPWGNGGSSAIPANEDHWVYVAKGESTPRTYTCYLNNDTVETWIHSNEVLNKGLLLMDYYEGNETSDLKKFNNAALELTLNEEIFIEASAAVYPNTPQTIQFKCDASSAACGSISRYEWDFDINDGYYDGDTRQNPVYCYQTAGQHTYAVKVIDASGHSRIQYGTVNVNPVSIAAYYGISDPKTLRFVTSTNYNCSYTWDFGDNSVNYVGLEGYHKYTAEGTYNVKLTLTNNYGVNPLVINKTLKYYHPIVLVHGFNDDTTRFTVLYDYLKPIVFANDMNVRTCAAQDTVTGEPVHTVFNFDYYRLSMFDAQFNNVGVIGTDGTTVLSTTSGNGSFGDQYNTLSVRYSALLSQMVEKICAATGFDKVDLVAHSMGGLVCRSYIKYYGGNNRVGRLLTCGTPNHGIGDLQAFVARLTPSRSWQSELEAREMDYTSDTFYTTAGLRKSYTELLNHDGDIQISGHTIAGCGNDDTIAPTRYATIAGTDKGNVNFPVADLIWEWLAPNDGIVDVGSVGLHGVNVDANFLYPGTHAMQVPGTISSCQSVIESPFVASFVNTWMRQDRVLNAVSTKPAAWVDVQKYADGTVSKFVAHTGANRSNAIWTWVMLQHEEEVLNGNDTKMIYTYKDYNSFWRDLSNEQTDNEVVVDLSPAHYVPGDTLRITVITYDTQGVKVEYIPVQL